MTVAEDPPETLSLYQELERESLSPDSSFRFHCHADLPCFNQCCRTPTIILSPYDLLRLRQALGITSGQLLERYTRQEIEPSSHLPLVCIDTHRSAEGGSRSWGRRAARFIPIGRRPAASFPYHGQPAHPGRGRGPLLLPPVGLLPGIRWRDGVYGGRLDGPPGIFRV